MTDDKSDQPSFTNKIIDGKYSVKKLIGSGSFGSVYSVTRNSDDAEFVVKIERKRKDTCRVVKEYKVLLQISHDGFPKIEYFFADDSFCYLIMERLGPNLHTLFHLCSNKFSLKTTLILFDKIVKRLHCLHSHKIIHQDIKPSNILLGRNKFHNKVYLIDFGLSKQWKPNNDSENKKPPHAKGVIGTVKYASLNSHELKEMGPHDDLESCIYMCIYFIKGKLPWENVHALGDFGKVVYAIKKEIKIEELCENLPDDFKTLLQICRGRDWREKPDYEMIRHIIHKMMDDNKIKLDSKYDWVLAQKGISE